MSHQTNLPGHHDAEIAAAEVDILVVSDHPALATGRAAEELKRIEAQYRHVVELLVQEKSAAAARIEDLETTNAALLKILGKKMADEVNGIFVQTHIVPAKRVVLRPGEELWSGIFKHV
ncbi:uncharacterized protein J4E87_001953 [Alternaria ethzedia]|uniref:uncharacterized protein n=1 Tax=Alternaria ethzedia TaxID=181014 RepID=UPI0020C4E66A|nr:uncharacterized protein J4E87_001953 [Alternaria ethzedia]KAI4632480.1 hypothetical protein J4E87_001953 [Alternaria ethzedia]